MSLTQALATAMSGLRANQAALALVSSNVANAETPGYVRKSLNQVTAQAGDIGTGVRIAGVNRELDEYIQTQLRAETSGASYAGIRSTFLQNLQTIYGEPGSSATIEGAFNALTTAMQALSTSPDSQSARIGVVNAARAMAQQLNATSQGIQSLRGSAETGINDAVTTVNAALRQIATINTQLQRGQQGDASTAALLDTRDQYLTQISQYLDVRVVTNADNQVNVFTGSGVQLVGVDAAQLSFNPQGTVTPNTLYNANPAKSGVGTLTINFPQGGSLDLVEANAIRSGRIAAYLELRDHSLVQAQNQIDQFAAAMSSALSDKTTDGAAVASGAQNGFDLDLTGLKTGNVVHISYKDNTTGLTQNLSIIRVDDPSVLPLKNSATVDPNDRVIGIDFSGGMAAVVTQLNAALGTSANLQFSNPSGSMLRVLDDGAANLSDVTAASVTTTVSSLTSGNVQYALFSDTTSLYSGAIDAGGMQQTGYAARIAVNPALLADPSRTQTYSTSPLTATGDTSRIDFAIRQLKTGAYMYSSQTGLGTASSPFKGTLLSLSQQIVSMQGDAAAQAQQLAEGQNVVLNTLQKKMDASSGVNIDEEMAHLLSLQNAYSANARVMATVKDMYTTLLQAM